MANDLENVEKTVGDFFKAGVSGSGEEELLRIASNFSLQLYSDQIKCALFCEIMALRLKRHIKPKFQEAGEILENFIPRWLKLKEQNNSADFVQRCLEFISLRRFLNEQSFKVNIQKGQ